MGRDTLLLQYEHTKKRKKKQLVYCMFSAFYVANAIDTFMSQSNKLLIIEKTIGQHTNCHLLWLNIMIQMKRKTTIIPVHDCAHLEITLINIVNWIAFHSYGKQIVCKRTTEKWELPFHDIESIWKRFNRNELMKYRIGKGW